MLVASHGVSAMCRALVYEERAQQAGDGGQDKREHLAADLPRQDVRVRPP